MEKVIPVKSRAHSVHETTVRCRTSDSGSSKRARKDSHSGETITVAKWVVVASERRHTHGSFSKWKVMLNNNGCLDVRTMALSRSPSGDELLVTASVDCAMAVYGEPTMFACVVSNNQAQMSMACPTKQRRTKSLLFVPPKLFSW